MINVGIIGVGSMGRNHVRNLAELGNYFKISGFYDMSDENAGHIQRLYKISRYSEAQRLIEESDAVIIAAPSSFHKHYGLMAAEMKKHALIEKPIALKAYDAELICEGFEKSGTVLAVGHIERYNPVVTVLKSILDEKQDIIALESKRCSSFDPRISDTNVIFDLMIHDLDIVLNGLYTVPVRTVNAAAVNAKSENGADFVKAIIQYETGVVASFLASRVTEDKIRTLDIHLKSCYIHADLLKRTLHLTKNSNFSQNINEGSMYRQESILERIVVPIIEPLKAELIHFANAINRGEKPLTDGFSSTRALKYAELVNSKCEDIVKIEA